MSHSIHFGFNSPLFPSMRETCSGSLTPLEDAAARFWTVSGLYWPFQSDAAGVGHIFR